MNELRIKLDTIIITIMIVSVITCLVGCIAGGLGAMTICVPVVKVSGCIFMIAIFLSILFF